MNPNAAMAVVTILIAAVVRAGLDTAFKPLFDGQHSWYEFYGLRGAQLFVFFILVLRFYLGSLRFSATEPKRIDFVVRTFNFIFSFMVFSAFYVLALSVTLSQYYYVVIVVLHAIDVCWFGLLYPLSHFWFVPVTELEMGEFPIEVVRKNMRMYLFFSVTTIAYGLLAYPYIFHVSLNDPNATNAHWGYLILLICLSLFDFWALSDYYFDFEAWRAKHAKGSGALVGANS